MLVAAATVFLGTFYPVFMDVLHGDKISVGPPYFHWTFVPIFILLFMLLTFGPLLNWKRDTLGRLVQRARIPLAVGGATLLAGALVFGVRHLLATLGLGLGVWLIVGAGVVLARRWRVGQVSWSEVAALARATPLAVIGLVIAHAGLGVTTVGITAVNAWQTNKVLSMSPGQSVVLAGNTITMQTLRPVTGANFEANEATFDVSGAFGHSTLKSERRLYPASQTTTTDAGIGPGVLGNIYISVADPNPDGGVTVRMWNHPFVDWIWAGALMMAFGGMVSLSDRGLRVAKVERRVAAPAALVVEPAAT